MSSAYEDIKVITDKYYTDWREPPAGLFIDLLEKYGIALRDKDGIFIEATVSVPKSKKDAVALGIRYEKKNGTPTEDLFLFQKDLPIQKPSKRNRELGLYEYRGTHKASFNTRG